MPFDPAHVTFTTIPARDADRVRLAELVNAAFFVYPFMSGPRTSPEGIAEECGDDANFVLAMHGGATRACAMVRPALGIEWGVEPVPAAATDPCALYLGLVAVEPAIRKSGLGKRLVAESERAASERGGRAMVLGTLAEMGNVTYYEALGYRSLAQYPYETGHWGISIAHTFHIMEHTL
jgi:GNAT superfamily N-acetyltransferase